MPTLNDYLNLIPSANRNKPNFEATVSLDVSVQVRVQELLASMISIFDIDVARGDQLDILGKWIGVSRLIKEPISGVYFSWDSTAAVGWDYGTWQGNLTPGEITLLPDDAYRTLLKAKIAANQWDGTTQGAYEIWDAVFTQIQILIKDNQNMTYELGFYGGIIDSLTLALVLGGYIPLKPEGVRLIGVFTPANTGPLFGFDIENDVFKGWDEGSWMIFNPVT